MIFFCFIILIFGFMIFWFFLFFLDFWFYDFLGFLVLRFFGFLVVIFLDFLLYHFLFYFFLEKKNLPRSWETGNLMVGKTLIIRSLAQSWRQKILQACFGTQLPLDLGSCPLPQCVVHGVGKEVVTSLETLATDLEFYPSQRNVKFYCAFQFLIFF